VPGGAPAWRSNGAYDVTSAAHRAVINFHHAPKRRVDISAAHVASMKYENNGRAPVRAGAKGQRKKNSMKQMVLLAEDASSAASHHSGAALAAGAISSSHIPSSSALSTSVHFIFVA